MIAEPARLLLQSGTLALWSVLRNRRRVALAVCSVTFGITALILAGGFIEWIFWATREGTIQGGLGHVHVARKGFQDHGTADLDRFLLPAESPILQKLRDRPGVRVVAPRRSFSGLVSHGDITLSFIAEGIDPEAERNFGDVSIFVDGNDLTSRSERAIIMGQGLAANLGVSVGETVVLLVNRANGGVGAVEAHVNGLFATVSKAYDDSAIRIPLTLATELLRTPGSHEWVVVLTDTEHTAQATEALRAEFADSGLEFVPWYDLADFYNKTVTLLSRQMGVIQTIIALIIVLTIGNSMMMGVIERTSEMISFRGSLVSFERSVRNYQELEDTVKQDVRASLSNLLESRESLKIQASSVLLADRRVASVQLLLDAGRAQIRDLLDAQDSLISAQNAYTSALVSYRISELELQRDLGLLEVDKDGIWREFDPAGVVMP